MRKDCQPIEHFPEDIRSLPRRRFIKRLFGGAAGAFMLPSLDFHPGGKTLQSLEATAAKDRNDEGYWRSVKEHFMLRPGLIMLNAANLCPAPYPVQQMVFDLTRDIDKDPSFFNRDKFNEMRENSRLALAKFVGADPDEIAITRNTSEGNNIVISGLTFSPGDEVVIWDENHPTANVAWDMRAQRYGFSVKKVKVPPAISDESELILPFQKAINRRTRVICFSHVSNVSGIALPAAKICRMAREFGVLSHIDGAQTFGSQVIDLHNIGCDFYTGSSHKWFCGPKEVGILFVRRENIGSLWPSIVGVGFPGAEEKGAQKFETLGQRDDARVAAMGKTVEFFNIIGKENIEKRIQGLAHFLKQELRNNIPQIEFLTPETPEFSGGVVVFSAPHIDFSKALDTLYTKFSVGGAVFGGERPGIRFCPHIYNSQTEIERAADAVSCLV